MSAATNVPGIEPGPMIEPHMLELSWKHPAGLWSLSFINFGLRIVTLGLYNFWGKAETRSRLWSGVRINGEPLMFGGTGLELFLGFLVAMLYVFVPYAVLIGTQLTAGIKSPIAGVVGMLFFVVLNWMWSVAVFRARRYRLTRTTWRGIRGNLVGSANGYAWTAMWTLFVVSLSLGLAYPWRQTRLQRILVEGTRFGDQPLTFTATSGRLYGPFLIMGLCGAILYGLLVAAIIGMVAAKAQQPGTQLPPAIYGPLSLAFFALGYGVFWLSGTWFTVRSFNHYSRHTHLGEAHFAGTASAAGLAWLGLGNALLAVLPLIGIALLAALTGSLAGFDWSTLINARNPDTWLVRGAVLAGFLSFGLLAPVMAGRSARFWMSNLKLEGAVPLDDLRQATGEGSRLGEGLAQAFDIDVF
jgi:uncharacterized membrane protein YjgN (DUF898 family)